MRTVECRTQQELDAALKAGRTPHLMGDGHFVVLGSSSVEAWESSSVEAYGSSRVEAYGSSRVVARDSSSVEAYGSSSVEAYGSSSVEAWESSSVKAWESSRVKAYGSSRVEAYGSSSVEAWGSSRVKASTFVPVQDHGPNTTVAGGVHIPIRPATTVEDWCDFHGVKITGRGKQRQVVLYKAVDGAYQSGYGFNYTPGTVPVAADWDGGEKECGGGLHFCPHPTLTRDYMADPAHYIACPILISDLRVPQASDGMPNKIKARGCCAPVWEVDRHGDRIEAGS